MVTLRLIQTLNSDLAPQVACEVGRGTFENNLKKFSVVWFEISFKRNAPDVSQRAGRLHHIGRLVALAAEFARRKIRRIGFDQNAVRRQAGRDGAQLLGAS